MIRISELETKSKLSPAEKGELKALKSKQAKASKQQTIEHNTVVTNVFGKVATTSIKPTPIRFLESELVTLSNVADRLRSGSPTQVIAELGNLQEINRTKLIRAAVELLSERSNEEIIDAIKKVQMKMIK